MGLLELLSTVGDSSSVVGPGSLLEMTMTWLSGSPSILCEVLSQHYAKAETEYCASVGSFNSGFTSWPRLCFSQVFNLACRMSEWGGMVLNYVIRGLFCGGSSGVVSHLIL